MTAAIGARAGVIPRPAHAFRSYLLLLRWQVLRRRKWLPFVVALQVVLGVSIIYGFAFLIPHVTPTVALYLATGATTITLTLVGLAAVPQEMAMARVNGREGYMEALPVPRLAPMLAEVTFWVLVQLPGALATLGLAVVRFHVHLHVSVLIVPTVVLVTLSAAAVGCAISVSLPPEATQQVSQLLSLLVLLFSPIDFPLGRLPVVLQDLHRGLPFLYMADIVRGSLTGDYGTGRALAFGVVAAWCGVGLFATGRAVTRRR